MAEKITIEKIENVKIDRDQSVQWAQERTLQKLVSLSDEHNELLERIAKARGIDTSGIRSMASSAQTATKNLTEYGEATSSSSKGMKSFNRSLYDLQGSMGNLQRNIGGFVSGSNTALGMLPGAIAAAGSAVSTGLGMLGPVGRGAAVAVAGLTKAAEAVTERMNTYIETYRQMIQTGVAFDGNLLDMVATVRRAGVGFQTATQIAAKNTTMLLVNGERQFFGTVERMSGTFSRFGLTMDQGAETLAELMETQRLSGALYTSSQGDLEQANVRMLNLMKSQERLTGVNVRRQMDEQRAVMQRASLQLLLARRSPDEQARALEVRTNLQGMGLNQAQQTSIMTEMLTGVTTRAGAELRVLFGDAIDQTIAGGRAQMAGDTTGMDAAREAMRVSYNRAIEQHGTVLAIGMEAGNQRLAAFAETLVAVKNILDPSTLGPNADAIRNAAQNIRDGGEIMVGATRIIMNFTNQASLIAGAVEAAVVSSRAADVAFNTLARSLSVAADQALRLAQGRGPGFTPSTIAAEAQIPATGARRIDELTPGDYVPSVPAQLRLRSESILVRAREQALANIPVPQTPPITQPRQEIEYDATGAVIGTRPAAAPPPAPPAPAADRMSMQFMEGIDRLVESNQRVVAAIDRSGREMVREVQNIG